MNRIHRFIHEEVLKHPKYCEDDSFWGLFMHVNGEISWIHTVLINLLRLIFMFIVISAVGLIFQWGPILRIQSYILRP